jgi:hypothetical protein
VRIEQQPNSSDLAITWVRVKIRQAGTGSAAAFFQNLVISHSENVRNPETTLTQSGIGNHEYDDPTSRMNLSTLSVIEYDIGPNARVEEVWIYGDSLIEGWNKEVRVQFLKEDRVYSVGSLVAAQHVVYQSPYNFMEINHDNTVTGSNWQNGNQVYKKFFVAGNDIEVTFDNRDVVKIMHVDRVDGNLLRDDDNLTRRFFMRAMFDSATQKEAATGLMTLYGVNRDLILDYIAVPQLKYRPAPEAPPP